MVRNKKNSGCQGLGDEGVETVWGMECPRDDGVHLKMVKTVKFSLCILPQ